MGIIRDQEVNPDPFSPEEAYSLLNSGTWMTNGNVTCRNVRGSGQCWDKNQPYPTCVRQLDTPITLEDVQAEGGDWYPARLS